MKSIVSAAFVLLLLFSAASCSSGHYVSAQADMGAYNRPPQPGPGYIWGGDNYYWRGGRYSYRPGYWVAPRRHRVWVPGTWVSTPRGYYWRRGRWH